MLETSSSVHTALRFLGICVLWIVCALGTLWATLALYFDVRRPALAISVALIFVLFVLTLLFITRAGRKCFAIWLLSIAAVATWWSMLSPNNSRNWQADVARLPWAEIAGDEATIHNVRNCDYVTEANYTPHWETKTVDFRQIRGVDLFLTHWGSPWIAHAILSFQIANGEYLAVSIEARKTVGQDYSAIRGFFRQYNLIYLVAEERDVVRVRTTFRKDEDVRLYHTMTTPADSRRLFLAYLGWMNEVRNKPKWYNALTSNCTSGITNYLAKAKVGGLSAWNWRTLLNGRGDEMLYDLGDLTRANLSFPDLKKQALINAAARQADNAPDFSQRIRAGHPGFSQTGNPAW